MLHATLRYARVWFEVTPIAFESIDNSAPVLPLLPTVGHGSGGSTDEDIGGVEGAIDIYRRYTATGAGAPGNESS